MKDKIQILILLVFFLWAGCSTLPKNRYKSYSFPRETAFSKKVDRPYRVLGQVRARVNYPSLDVNREESDLCQNYFNKAVHDLVGFAKDKGGDAVIDVQSVVFLEDGRREVYPKAECSDDGLEGQVLTQGIAIQWIGPKQSQLLRR